RRSADGRGVVVEVRAINNRFLKVSCKLPDGYSAWESEIEALVRKHVKRGTIQINLRLERVRRPEDYKLNTAALTGYRAQLDQLRREWGLTDQITLDQLLSLPGVVLDDRDRSVDLEGEWPAVSATVEEALVNLQRMREQEGVAMGRDLAAQLESIATITALVEDRAPQVVDQHRIRLHERISRILAEHQATIEPNDLIRETAVFAERTDVAEELVRLKSHLVQMTALFNEHESTGRKLDFLTQELFREANTIGSKANDVVIAQHVVEIKTAIERIREMVQNIE
ncbi:MAG TPA: YicC/YloC family endoribonuclease, partial [Pirellulales bacterium]